MTKVVTQSPDYLKKRVKKLQEEVLWLNVQILQLVQKSGASAQLFDTLAQSRNLEEKFKRLEVAR